MTSRQTIHPQVTPYTSRHLTRTSSIARKPVFYDVNSSSSRTPSLFFHGSSDLTSFTSSLCVTLPSFRCSTPWTPCTPVKRNIGYSVPFGNRPHVTKIHDFVGASIDKNSDETHTGTTVPRRPMSRYVRKRVRRGGPLCLRPGLPSPHPTLSTVQRHESREETHRVHDQNRVPKPGECLSDRLK